MKTVCSFDQMLTQKSIMNREERTVLPEKIGDLN